MNGLVDRCTAGGLMDGWTRGWTDGFEDGWTDERMDGRTEMDKQSFGGQLDGRKQAVEHRVDRSHASRACGQEPC